MTEQLSILLTHMVEQAPTIAALLYLVVRQEKAIERCYGKLLDMVDNGER